eukprot:5572495-Alexandrium_andersonii.AAC.1
MLRAPSNVSKGRQDRLGHWRQYLRALEQHGQPDGLATPRQLFRLDLSGRLGRHSPRPCGHR